MYHLGRDSIDQSKPQLNTRLRGRLEKKNYVGC